MTDLVKWLLEEDDWLKYSVVKNLLGRDKESAEVIVAEKKFYSSTLVQLLHDDVLFWPIIPLKSHKDSKHPLHKLALLAELGADISNKRTAALMKKVMISPSSEGFFQLMGSLHARQGGEGPVALWYLCDAPLILWSLLKMGVSRTLLKKGIDYIISIVHENGWHCAVSSQLGTFRGPGKREDPCPYANLLALKLFSILPEYHDKKFIANGISSFFSLWDMQKERKQYLFGIGTDFRKLKMPEVWFDIIHVADVLSHYEKARGDSRFGEIMEILKSKKDSEGKFTPESVYRTWKDYDFGQKKTASRFITYKVMTIILRSGL